ncbi:wax ester/triacylglycerol synthase domain-containing protein [Rhodococcus sp. UNC363MFTsu5.1]|uniref:wax ester/triacylglycerol synthase domain-containing protein n=1 Tax=Rhodococcus sp. UNC363MFTsu5.1 TaxID=1449069 RepID=UPI000486324D|nr:wax ester/triacylglycerol synthase domain-containing protein [Rhodococcus sp. UNC363MFTsu5.1]
MTDESPLYMNQADLMAWRMEADPVLRSTIVALLILDRSPDWRRVESMMDRATTLAPHFRCKVVETKLGPAPPRWVVDPDFDLSWHLRRFTLAAPEMQSVLDFAQTTGSTAFDRERPLWELTVLDGLSGGRAAIVLKVHHALTDGVGGMAITREIVDLTRAGERPLTTPPVQREPTNGAAPSWYRLSAAALSRQVMDWAPQRVRSVVDDPLGTARGAAATLMSVARFVRPIATTLSPVMTARSTRRRFALLEVPIEDLSQAASCGSGSINDAFIVAVLLAMRHYHHRCGAAVDRLRVTIPMSLRTERDPLEGNKITLARLTLPADTDDPAVLIRQVHATIGRWRIEPAIPFAPAIAGVLNMLPPALLGNMLRHVDFVASDVVGSPEPLYIAGSRVDRYFAFSPTLGAAFNATMVSYGSRCCVGLDSDAAAVPDVGALRESMVEGFRRVLELRGQSALDGAEDAVR